MTEIRCDPPSYDAPKDFHDYGGDPRFLQILHEMAALHAKKQEDYGTDEDPLANIRASEKFGIPAWVGALVRMQDKMQRLQKYVSAGKLSNESADDSLIDLSVYAILCLLLLRESRADSKT